MLIRRINGADVLFSAPADANGCAGLSVRRVDTPAGRFVVSAWEPTPDEMRRIVAGEPIYLWVRGSGHPVVSLTVAGDPHVGI